MLIFVSTKVAQLKINSPDNEYITMQVLYVSYLKLFFFSEMLLTAFDILNGIE